MQPMVHPSIHPRSRTVAPNHARSFGIDVIAGLVRIVQANENNGQWPLSMAIQIIRVVPIEQVDGDAPDVATDHVNNALTTELTDRRAVDRNNACLATPDRCQIDWFACKRRQLQFPHIESSELRNRITRMLPRERLDLKSAAQCSGDVATARLPPAHSKRIH